MRTRSALALSVAGILVTGSAALAVNAQTLNGSPAGTTGNASQFLLPQDSATSPATSPVTGAAATTASPTPTATATATATAPASESPDDDDSTASPSPTASASPSPSDEPGDDHGGLRETPEPGDDHGGHGASEPGDDHGGHGSDD